MKKLGCDVIVITLCAVTAGVFITLKLFKLIAWKWIWITSPVWICIIGIILGILLIKWLADHENVE